MWYYSGWTKILLRYWTAPLFTALEIAFKVCEACSKIISGCSNIIGEVVLMDWILQIEERGTREPLQKTLKCWPSNVTKFQRAGRHARKWASYRDPDEALLALFSQISSYHNFLFTYSSGKVRNLKRKETMFHLPRDSSRASNDANRRHYGPRTKLIFHSF